MLYLDLDYETHMYTVNGANRHVFTRVWTVSTGVIRRSHVKTNKNLNNFIEKTYLRVRLFL